jgi:hypothetical protein
VNVGPGNGEIKIDGVTVPSNPYTMDVANGTTVIIEAVPNFGRVFRGWSGDLTSNTNPTAVLIDCDHNITANFSLDWRLIGTVIGCVVLVIFLVSVLIIRRKA